MSILTDVAVALVIILYSSVGNRGAKACMIDVILDDFERM